jgi:hypothetical protein
VLGLGVVAEQVGVDYFLNAALPRARALLVNARHRAAPGPGNHSVPTPDRGSIDRDFILGLLEDTRSQLPHSPVDVQPGVTNFRMFRVWIANGLNNLMFKKN